MNKNSNPNQKTSCKVCNKELPLSAAYVPENIDYVQYFCCQNCYKKWLLQQNERRKNDE